MIRTRGEAGSGNVVEAVHHMRQVKEHGRLRVVMFTDCGIATPADAAMMMQLGAIPDKDLLANRGW